MSNSTFENRLKSTTRNIKQRSQLKYSKHGTFTWDKWIEYDCIFSSATDDLGRQYNQLELYTKNNLPEFNRKIIDLRQLHSLTCLHGNTNKNEPKDIIVIKIDGKKHRLGFDNTHEYNQWKTLLDGVFNSSNTIHKTHSEENVAVNMLYDSVTAKRYRVYFADQETQEILSLPNEECELIFDTDKLVLEQRQDKQYTFARSTIRTLRLKNTNQIEFELGSRAPVQGFIRFRFISPDEARSCYSQWNEGTVPLETSRNHSAERFTTKRHSHEDDIPRIPPREPYELEHSYPPPRPPPRSLSTKGPYYNTDTTPSTTSNGSHDTYTAFQTLV